MRLRFDLSEQVVRQLLQDEPHNQDDIVQLLRTQTQRPGIQAYVQRQQLASEAFVNYMAARAQGNFMYLRYVLPEIEGGAYADLALEHLPVGLENYYEDHWRRIRQRMSSNWFAAQVTGCHRPNDCRRASIPGAIGRFFAGESACRSLCSAYGF